MLGNFQRSELRIEVPATASTIRDRLLSPPALKKWLFPQQMTFPSQDLLSVGTSQIEPVLACIVDAVSDHDRDLLDELARLVQAKQLELETKG